MNRLLAMMSAATLALTVQAAAQNTMPQPGPQGTTQNQNAPQMQMSPAQPSQAPSAGTNTVAPATIPAPNATTPPSTGKSDAATAANGAANAGATNEKTETTSPATKDTAKTGKADNAEPNATENSEPAPSTKTPHVEMVGTPTSGPQSADPLLQPPPLPPNKSTLIGGIAKKVDRVRNSVVVAPFGSSKKIKINFDERSHIYRDSRETTVLGIQKGDRIYADTMLVGPQVFARNLRVVTTTTPAEASGQIVAYDPRTQTVRLVDKLTNSPVTFRVTKDTELRSKTGTATATDIQPGALVSVIFAPGQKGGDAKQLSILAVPGSNYIFAGRITNLDLHRGIIDVDNQSDGKNYELHFPPAMENRAELHIGAQVAAKAAFDGHTYSTEQVTVMPEQSQNAQQ